MSAEKIKEIEAEMQAKIERENELRAAASQDYSIEFLDADKAMEHILPLLLGFIIAAGASYILYYCASLPSSKSYYSKLKKSGFNPSLSTILQVSILGYFVLTPASWVIYVKHDGFTWPVLAWVIHMVVAPLWSPSLFMLRELSLAFLMTMISTASLMYTTYSFAEDVHMAAYIAMPIVGWNVALTVLCGQLWYNNEMKEMLGMQTGSRKRRGGGRRKIG
eukprot:TRINITY_DN66476_c10_g1_i2.p1 TRINITY_DN66476_c10_g1~~TRINITY_DN66476_c10_g1_i2.p1  ORF type:complete len:231 (-),score=26.54 TRINITY_DN66476_c10_g1_i2:591-1250(-)